MFKIVFVLFALLSFSYSAVQAPDFSNASTDFGIAFGAIVTLMVSLIGFKYVRRMFF